MVARTARAILAVPLKPHPSRRGTNNAGTRRRVEALAWMGWTVRDIAQRAGIPRTSLTHLASGRPVSHAVALGVACVYDDLAGVQGTSAHARSKARRYRYAPPAAWDDDTIDDPNAHPQGIRRPSREQQRAARAGRSEALPKSTASN
jgi:hypothetical protein